MYIYQGKKKRKANKVSGSDSDILASGDSDDEHGDRVLKKKSATQYIVELQVVHICAEHVGQHCIVRPNGLHHQLIKQDFSLWSLLLVHCHDFLILTLPSKHKYRLKVPTQN
jgi:hypothetical protein